MLNSMKSVLANERIKWVDPVNIHITLAFLGDTETKRIQDLAVILEKACTGFGQLAFSLTGTGLFKSGRDPRIIWTGIDNSGNLIKLNSKITDELKKSSFVTDSKTYRPHLTIGRIKSVHDKDLLITTIERYRDMNLQLVKVTEITLFESVLKPSGPEYITLRSISLVRK